MLQIVQMQLAGGILLCALKTSMQTDFQPNMDLLMIKN